MEELLTQIFGYLRGMWRFRWWGLAATWVFGVIGGAIVYTMPDRYESSARVFVDTQSVLRPLMSGLAVQPNIEQQVTILSRTLITRPNVEKLITMADLDHEARTPAQREAMILDLIGDLQIRSTGRDNLFTLAYQDKRAERAQRVVQALVSLFVESGLVGKQQDASSARRFIDEQISGYEQKLSEAENRLKDFRLRNMALLGDSEHDYVSQIAQLNARVQEAQLELKEAENSRGSIERQLAGEKATLGADAPATTNGLVSEYDTRIDTMKKNLDGLLQRYTNEHPDVVGTRRVIADLEEQKRRELESASKAGGGTAGSGAINPVYQQLKVALADADAKVSSLRARVGELMGRVAQLRSQAELLPKIEAEQAQLNRDYEVHKRNYESLVQRRESASISVEMNTKGGVTEFRVIDPPSLPLRPAAPNRMLLLPLAGLAALLGGMAVSFALAQLRPAFTDLRNLREITGLPVLGTVTMLRDAARTRAERRGLLAFSGGIASYAIVVAGATAIVKLLQG
jgi:polysaccharide chain length determinant protein (PEP-CTERM system associated)